MIALTVVIALVLWWRKHKHIMWIVGVEQTCRMYFLPHTIFAKPLCINILSCALFTSMFTSLQSYWLTLQAQLSISGIAWHWQQECCIASAVCMWVLVHVHNTNKTGTQKYCSIAQLVVERILHRVLLNCEASHHNAGGKVSLDFRAPFPFGRIFILLQSYICCEYSGGRWMTCYLIPECFKVDEKS